MRFFDTNILVYAATDQDPRKRDIARELIGHAIEVNHDGCISTQVLGEFCNTMLRKSLRTKEEIDGMLDYFRELLEIDVTIDLVRLAATKSSLKTSILIRLIGAWPSSTHLSDVVAVREKRGRLFFATCCVDGTKLDWSKRE